MFEGIETGQTEDRPSASEEEGLWFRLTRTWTGRLIVINTLVFLAMVLYSGAIFMPDPQTLLLFGVKDPVRLAQGEVWRLVTPMFVHIGVLHFAINNFMLYVLGRQLETLLGSRWFLLIYLTAGLAGNIASALFTVNPSAGASGAIFGLLGCGYFIERTVNKRFQQVTGQGARRSAYGMTVLINLVFGFLVPFVDNSAHIGGLLAGLILTYVMVGYRRNTVQQEKSRLPTLVMALSLGSLAVGSYFSVEPTFQAGRLEAAADRAATNPRIQLGFYSQAIEIEPQDGRLRVKRARLFFYADEPKLGLADLRTVVGDPDYQEEIKRLADELEQNGLATSAWQVRRFVAHGSQAL